MKKKKFKFDTSTIFVVLLSTFIIFMILINPDIISLIKKPFTTVSIFPVQEPISANDCKKLGGILILPEQDCSKEWISWGYGIVNGEKRQCCIIDKCSLGQYKGKYQTLYNEQTQRFERKCICPSPSEFTILEGCKIPYK